MNPKSAREGAAPLDEGKFAVLQVVEEAQFDEPAIVGAEGGERRLDLVLPRDRLDRGVDRRTRFADGSRLACLAPTPGPTGHADLVPHPTSEPRPYANPGRPVPRLGRERDEGVLDGVVRVGHAAAEPAGERGREGKVRADEGLERPLVAPLAPGRPEGDVGFGHTPIVPPLALPFRIGRPGGTGRAPSPRPSPFPTGLRSPPVARGR